MSERRPNIQEDYYPGSSDYPKHKKAPDLPNFFDAAYQGLNPEQQVILKDLVEKWRSAKGQGKRVYTEELKLTLREFGVWRDAAFDFLNEVKRPSVKKETAVATADQSEEKLLATEENSAIHGRGVDQRTIKNILPDEDSEEEEDAFPQEPPSVIGSRRSVVNEFSKDFEGKAQSRRQGMPHGRVRRIVNNSQVQHIGKHGPQKPRYKDHRSLDGRLSVDDQATVKRFKKTLEIEHPERPLRKKPLREPLPILADSEPATGPNPKPFLKPEVTPAQMLDQTPLAGRGSSRPRNTGSRPAYLEQFPDRPNFLHDARKAWGQAIVEKPPISRAKTVSSKAESAVLEHAVRPSEQLLDAVEQPSDVSTTEARESHQNFLDKLTSPLQDFLERLRGRERDLRSKEANEKKVALRFRIHLECDRPFQFPSSPEMYPTEAEHTHKRQELAAKLGMTAVRYGSAEDKLLEGITTLLLARLGGSKDVMYYATDDELKKVCAQLRGLGLKIRTEKAPVVEFDPRRRYKLVVQGLSEQGQNYKISYVKTIREVLGISTLEAKLIVDMQVAMEKSTQPMPTELPGRFDGTRVRAIEEALLAAGAKSVQIQPVA